MPELPEVETVRRSLVPLLVGRRLEGVRVRERRLRTPVDLRALRRLACGQRVEDLTRRAKYLMIHLPQERRLLIHLGMSGRLLLLPRAAPTAPHEHIVFDVEGGLQLRFRDHRRFGLVEATSAARLDSDRRFCTLGVEPLSRSCTAKYFYTGSRRVKQPIKNFLMDARRVVGVGNIYASEALFAAGVHPARAAGRLSLARWETLTRCIKRVLRDAIRQGGTTLNDFRNASGEAGYFQVYLRVYQREGEACTRCKGTLGTIRKTVQAGRSTFYCPRCQR